MIVDFPFLIIRDGKQSADCRFSIPNGLVIIPDVSCVTSFESRSVTTKYEFFKSLSVAASVEGSGWGVSFSASVNYKETSSVIASGEYIYIYCRVQNVITTSVNLLKPNLRLLMTHF